MDYFVVLLNIYCVCGPLLSEAIKIVQRLQ